MDCPICEEKIAPYSLFNYHDTTTKSNIKCCEDCKPYILILIKNLNKKVINYKKKKIKTLLSELKVVP